MKSSLAIVFEETQPRDPLPTRSRDRPGAEPEAEALDVHLAPCSRWHRGRVARPQPSSKLGGAVALVPAAAIALTTRHRKRGEPARPTTLAHGRPCGPDFTCTAATFPANWVKATTHRSLTINVLLVPYYNILRRFSDSLGIRKRSRARALRVWPIGEFGTQLCFVVSGHGAYCCCLEDLSCCFFLCASRASLKRAADFCAQYSAEN